MTEVVTSLQNQLVKTTAALKQKKFRDELGMFAVEGIRLAEELADAGWPAQLCFFTGKAAAGPRAAAVLARLGAAGCRLIEVSETVMAKLADTEESQGLLVVVPKRRPDLATLLAKSVPLIAVMDGIRDPGNAGTVIRTAAAAGCDGVIMLAGCADLFGPKTVRATMGALFHLPVAENVGEAELIAALLKTGVKLVATALGQAQSYTAADLTGPVAVVFGSEGQGVGEALLKAAQSRLYIPLYGRAESLNVAAAAAVILYEAARQRRPTL